MSSDAEILGVALTDYQIGRCERLVRLCRVGCFALVEVVDENCRIVGVNAGDVGADIGKEAPADRGGQAVADLHHP